MSNVHVLHIAESFKAGVRTAILTYVHSCPEVSHSLLASTGRAHAPMVVPDDTFAHHAHLPDNPVAAVIRIRRAVHDWDPDVIHAHSSFAGIYARLAVRNDPRHRIVYTPHAFSFERLDLSPARRRVAEAVERQLSRNTWAIAACSPREAHLAEKMHARHVVYVPNIAGSRFREHPSRDYSDSRPAKGAAGPRLACVARIAPQHDPSFITKFLEILHATLPDAQLVWIGDGQPEMTRRLEAAGVHVTGWLSTDQELEVLNGVDALIHPGVWDGMPMAILEVSALGMPILARRAPSLEGVSPEVTAWTPSELAAKTVQLHRGGPAAARANVELWSQFLAPNTPQHQAEVLRGLYDPQAGPAEPAEPGNAGPEGDVLERKRAAV